MTGLERLLERFPHREQNVFFSTCGYSPRDELYWKLWEKAVAYMREAIETAIQEGGRNFICQNRTRFDVIFLQLVYEAKRKHPDMPITLNICYNTKPYHIFLEKSDLTKRVYDAVGCTMTVFTEGVTRKQDYLTCMVMISGHVIGHVPYAHLGDSKLIGVCNAHQVPLYNVCAEPMLEGARIMERVFSDINIESIGLEWLCEQELAADTGEANETVDELLRIDQRYRCKLKEACLGWGAYLIAQYADDLISGIKGMV